MRSDGLTEKKLARPRIGTAIGKSSDTKIGAASLHATAAYWRKVGSKALSVARILLVSRFLQNRRSGPLDYQACV
jgi:hypothetical protein